MYSIDGCFLLMGAVIQAAIYDVNHGDSFEKSEALSYLRSIGMVRKGYTKWRWLTDNEVERGL